MIKEGVLIGRRYEILGRIGAGGMADVYKGRDHKLNRLVAIKVLKSDFRTDETFIKKFLSEAQAAAGLMHPNVVNVYDVGQDRGLYYMVMELVDGVTLKQYIERKGKLSYTETISIAIQMVSGIMAAHEHHIIHRDIKPQNIIISRDGKVKVTDFGIARASSSTQTISTNVMGSVHYISPEQARGSVVDEKTDIYSAGVTIYEMVTGHVPYDGDSTVAVAVKHLNEAFPIPSLDVPDIPRALEQIIVKCTQKSPADRYHSCSELIGALKRALNNPQGEAVTDTVSLDTQRTVVITADELEGRTAHVRSRAQSATGRMRNRSETAGAVRENRTRNRRRQEEPDDEQGMNRAKKIMLIAAISLAVLAVIFFGVQAAGFFKVRPSVKTQTEKKQVEVPSLVGLTETEAKAALNKKSLGFSVGERRESEEYEKGIVIEQSVAKGEKVDKNTQIVVVVSSGKKAKEIEIPDIKGYARKDAADALEKKGLIVTIEETSSEEVEKDKAIGTDPAAGTKAKEGDHVKLIISTGVEQISVPDLTGMTADDASAALAQAGLAAGKISEKNDAADKGTVIGQSISAGEKADKGTSVDLTVSLGPKVEMAAVPNLSGRQINDAISALQSAGLNVGEITKEYSSVVTKDYVISQTATGELEKGSAVGFTVSLGPEPSGNGGGSRQPSPGEHE